MKTRIRKSIVCLSAVLAGATACLPALGQAPSPANHHASTTPPTTTKHWTGDMDVLLKHRVIRVGVPYSKTLYYTVKGVQYGTAYETGKEFEKYLNKKYPQANKNIRTHVMFFVTRETRLPRAFRMER
jgi:hypothetical protein